MQVVIPLDSIKSVRLEKALSNASHGMLMFVETKSTPPKTFCFGIWLEPAEVVGERLKMAIEASKNAKVNIYRVQMNIISEVTLIKKINISRKKIFKIYMTI